jgi:hypothetical protein
LKARETYLALFVRGFHRYTREKTTERKIRFSNSRRRADGRRRPRLAISVARRCPRARTALRARGRWRSKRIFETHVHVLDRNLQQYEIRRITRVKTAQAKKTTEG